MLNVGQIKSLFNWDLTYDGNGNGIADWYELVDTDEDGLLDWWEMLHFGDLDAEPAQDPDNDLMPNSWEAAYGFNPVDGLDGLKTRTGTGSPNIYEYKHATDPLSATNFPVAGDHLRVLYTNSATIQSLINISGDFDIVQIPGDPLDPTLTPAPAIVP